jgi:hypothetical protein
MCLHAIGKSRQNHWPKSKYETYTRKNAHVVTMVVTNLQQTCYKIVPTVTGRFANESFRQLSVRQHLEPIFLKLFLVGRVGMLRLGSDLWFGTGLFCENYVPNENESNRDVGELTVGETTRWRNE